MLDNNSNNNNHDGFSCEQSGRVGLDTTEIAMPVLNSIFELAGWLAADR